MIVGYTGSEHVITRKQQWVVAELLSGFYDEDGTNRFHHGCCIVGDDTCARIAHALGYELHGHPPTDRKKVPRRPVVNTVDYPPLPYMKRNDRIVLDAQAFLVTPMELREITRSGVWATARRAVKAKRPGLVVWRNGDIVPLEEAVTSLRLKV